MDIADIADSAPEIVKEEEAIGDGKVDSNKSGIGEENKFQRAISAWRSMDGIVASFTRNTDRVPQISISPRSYLPSTMPHLTL